jgi:hypothetical protein
LKRSRLVLWGFVVLLLAAGAATATIGASPARAVTTAQLRPDGDSPPGFWYGSDSWPVPVTGSAPYSEPSIGGAYGGYIGITGSRA